MNSPKLEPTWPCSILYLKYYAIHFNSCKNKDNPFNQLNFSLSINFLQIKKSNSAPSNYSEKIFLEKSQKFNLDFL